ncbi:hypothetical protein D9Q98_007347 [Chlorella vulgaris]|uniref:Nucleotide-diphospho-sugar transferase domain-containing protein n=1 Tax=Chlorella vulgaris TaxID=3077 RepID=A0A9D4TL75_CHLVU|nr:hypothetical protein D9Q98_007347 [Chlorella vulgaris]
MVRLNDVVDAPAAVPTTRHKFVNNPYAWVGTLVLITAGVLALTALPHEPTAYHLKVGRHSFTISMSTDTAAAASKSGAAGTSKSVRQHGKDASTEPLPCEASGYCSLGVSKLWRGDVATNEGLRALLEAVSFKREIIFTMSDLKGYVLEMALNAVSSAAAQGYGHSLVLATDPAACSNIPAPYNATVSCVWDSREVVALGDGDIFEWWYKRWDFFARVVRMGYNVLSLDADAMITAEFYSFVKAEPFSKYNALFQDDGGGVNCGVVYFQNCHPSGPATWMAVEHPYRTSRQRENASHMQEVYKGWDVRDTWDQPFWNQMLSSVSHGKPHSTVIDKTPDQWNREMDPYRMRDKVQEIAWPQEWRNITGLEGSGPLVTYENLTLPIVDDAWWQPRRKYFYGPLEGAVSSQFMELIRTSMQEPFYEPGKPWAATELPQEHAAFLPCWFTCNYAFRGNQGFWDRTPVAAVVPHVVWMPSRTSDWKMYAFKGPGIFDFDVSEEVRGHNVLGLPNPKLLMFAPGVHLFAESEDAFSAAVTTLARLATMTGRKLVLPNPPCDSMWMNILPNIKHPWMPLWPHIYDGFQVMQFHDTMRGSNFTYCHWMRAFDPDCRAAMPMHADAVVFLERWEDREQATPGAANMLWHAEWQAAGGATAPPGPPKAILTPQPEVEVANAAALVEAAAAFADWPVLFLGAVPKLGSGDGLQAPSEEDRKCYLFTDEPPHFEPLGSTEEQRQKWLNGTLRRLL